MNDDASNPFESMTPADLVLPTGADVDIEARGREYLAAAKKRDAIARFTADCAKGYPESDWSHPKLTPYRAAIDRVLSWQFGPKGLIVSGPTGRGKTRSVFGLYRRLACEEARDVAYYFAGDWFSRLQQEIRYGRDDAREWTESVAARQIVILDDLGQEAVTAARSEWAQAWFFRFLDIRVAKRLPLIVTTNLDSARIAEAFGTKSNIRTDPLIRRLLELGDVVRFD